VAPFANLRAGSGLIKRHGITGATGDDVPAGGTAERSRSVGATPPRQTSAGDARTQRVTAKDFEAGRIRLPARSKSLLPLERADVQVVLRRKRLRARRDPRMGPPERSGVLGFGKGKLDGLVHVDEVLDVATGAGTDVELT
jgi:hypothetical protein